MLAGMALPYAATVKAVAAVYLGRETSVIGAYNALRGRIWSLFGTFGLIVLIVGAALVAVIIVAGLVTTFGLVEITAAGTAGAVVRVLVIAALAVAAFMAIYVRYALAIQACVVEGMGPRASL